MNHDAASDKLLDLAYGELGPREAREVAAHAEGCDACRGELARIRETRALMARLPEERPPEGGEAVVRAAARRAAEARKPRPLLPPWLWAGTAGAMAAALVAVVSWHLTRSPAHEPFKAGEGELLARGAPAAPPPPAPAPPAPASASVQEAARDEAARPGRPLGFLGGGAPAKRAEHPKAARPEGAAAREEVVRSSGTFDANAGPAAGAGAGGIGATEGAGWRSVEAERAPAPAAPPPAVAAAPEPASAPAQKARAMAAAERKMAAPAARADAAPEEFAPRELGGTETRSFPGCPGELSRIVERDAEGRVVRYVRIGARREVDQRYGPDGRLVAAAETIAKAARALPLDAAGLVRSARDVRIDMPPRCTWP